MGQTDRGQRWGWAALSRALQGLCLGVCFSLFFFLVFPSSWVPLCQRRSLKPHREMIAQITWGVSQESCHGYWYLFLVLSFCLFRAAFMAYGGSQARGPVGAIAATATATLYLSHVCDLHHQSRQQQILNSLSEARDRTRVLMDASQVR